MSLQPGCCLSHSTQRWLEGRQLQPNRLSLGQLPLSSAHTSLSSVVMMLILKLLSVWLSSKMVDLPQFHTFNKLDNNHLERSRILKIIYILAVNFCNLKMEKDFSKEKFMHYLRQTWCLAFIQNWSFIHINTLSFYLINILYSLLFRILYVAFSNIFLGIFNVFLNSDISFSC